jgi:tetratricopeptide (TPR) repeat protein
VADLQAIERELETARKRDDNHARLRLIPRALELPDAQPHRAAYLDELAYAYQQLGRFDDAVDAMRQAVAAGCDGELDDHPTAQTLIADLLLRAGHTQEADDAWLEAERDHPRDPWLHQSAGVAYADVGLYSKALPWQTKGLKLALAASEKSKRVSRRSTKTAAPPLSPRTRIRRAQARLVPGRRISAGARDLAELRRGLRARTLRGVLRATRTTPA